MASNDVPQLSDTERMGWRVAENMVEHVQRLNAMLAKVTTALHVSQGHASNLDIGRCHQGICPEVAEMLED